MRQHNWAFAAWEIEKAIGNLKTQSILVHVDAHLDDTPDGVFVEGLSEASSVEEILKVAQGHDFASGQVCPPNKMQIDNFIWAAVARATIGETIFVSHQAEDVLSLEEISYQAIEKRNEYCQTILSRLPIDCRYTHQRFHDLESFWADFDLRRLQMEQTKILDIDLDYFNRSEDVLNPRLEPIHQIRESLEKLKRLCDWNVITVAISPEYCGGNEAAKELVDAFLAVFDLRLEEAVCWDKQEFKESE
ncbi:hypothetical protein ACQCN2_03690 [Brevibacillus ginsengisoli]|uniref:hypothetical protein n=1 Tax=Brevibacillus ginsengisoli TaxID=363854 RepID=UPI003CF7B41B